MEWAPVSPRTVYTTLVRIGNEECLTAAVDLLIRKKGDVPKEDLLKLGERGITLLTEILQGNDKKRSQAAGETLNKIGWLPPTSTERVQYYLSFGELTKAAEEGAVAVAPLLSAFHESSKMHEEGSDSANALYTRFETAIRGIGGAAIPELLSRADTDDMAFACVTKSGDKRVIPYLIQNLVAGRSVYGSAVALESFGSIATEHLASAFIKTRKSPVIAELLHKLKWKPPSPVFRVWLNANVNKEPDISDIEADAIEAIIWFIAGRDSLNWNSSHWIDRDARRQLFSNTNSPEINVAKAAYSKLGPAFVQALVKEAEVIKDDRALGLVNAMLALPDPAAISYATKYFKARALLSIDALYALFGHVSNKVIGKSELRDVYPALLRLCGHSLLWKFASLQDGNALEGLILECHTWNRQQETEQILGWLTETIENDRPNCSKQGLILASQLKDVVSVNEYETGEYNDNDKPRYSKREVKIDCSQLNRVAADALRRYTNP